MTQFRGALSSDTRWSSRSCGARARAVNTCAVAAAAARLSRHRYRSEMRTVARCYYAGLPLAALARRGGGVVRARPRGLSPIRTAVDVPCPGVQPLRRFPPCCGDERLWLLPLVVDDAPRAATTCGTPTARATADAPRRSCQSGGAREARWRRRGATGGGGERKLGAMVSLPAPRNRPRAHGVWPADRPARQGPPDPSAKAGERSERKPGAATPRDGFHKENQGASGASGLTGL